MVRELERQRQGIRSLVELGKLTREETSILDKMQRTPN